MYEGHIMQETDWRGQPITELLETQEGLRELERCALSLSGSAEDHIAADVLMRRQDVAIKLQREKANDAATFWTRLAAIEAERKRKSLESQRAAGVCP